MTGKRGDIYIELTLFDKTGRIMDEQLKGKKALITGSSRGIGRVSALLFAKEGADIVIHYRREKEAAEQTAEEIRKMGRNALVCKADLEHPDEIDEMFDKVRDEWGHLDIFVANAAATAFKHVMELKDYHIDRTFQVVVKSVMQCVQRAVPLMEGTEAGRIIAISSHGSRYALPRYACLGLSKAALESITRYFASEFGPKGITSNAISPGIVETESSKYYAKDKCDEFYANAIEHTALGRLTQPSDVSKVALFLASEGSGFVTGQVIYVDGGLTLFPPGFEGMDNI